MLYQLPLEEKWNVYTHGFGALSSFLGLGFMLLRLPNIETTAYIALLVYGVSMIFLFSASAIYHGVGPQRQALWQKIDHIGIYFLIAGTYTPVTLTILKDSSGYFLLIGVWTLALLGTLYKIFFIGRFQNFSLFLYLAMGWLVIFDIQNIIAVFPKKAFVYLALGGFFYTVGTVFYRWERLYFHHVIWHVFVLGGAFSHFLMVYSLLI